MMWKHSRTPKGAPHRSQMSVLCKTTCFILAVTVSLGLIHLLTASSHQRSARDARPRQCRVADKVREEVAGTAHVVSRVLTRLGVNHALCFGSLWGVLRYGQLLPWEDRVHICAMKEDMSKASTSSLYKLLAENNLQGSYSFLDGTYEIFSTDRHSQTPNNIQVTITIFTKSRTSFSQRDGYRPWLSSFFATKTGHSFPTRLLKAPLKTLKFHGEAMPVPHEDSAILKYWYPDDWWREVPPPGCV